MSGKTFARLRTDALRPGGDSAFCHVDPDYREKTKRIVFDSRPASEVPADAVRIDEDCATPDAERRIYGWLTEDGTMYVWTNADAIRLTNKDAIYLYSDMKEAEEIDLSRIDTSELTTMNGMFYGCRGLTSLDVSSFDTSKVTDMSGMFYGCSKLKSLDLSSFDTSKAMDMSYMFADCSKLKSLDLSSFDTSKTMGMSYMFADCSGLKALNLSSFEVSDEKAMDGAFLFCNSLKKITVGDGWKRTVAVPGVSIVRKNPAKQHRVTEREGHER